MFGGSTMWGTGSPDWMTIPSYLQVNLSKELNQPVCVVNYGEGAWLSTQEVIQLLLTLKMGNIPDTVIFYDGGNDISHTIENAKRGLHHRYKEFVERFSESPPPPNIMDIIKQTNLFRLIKQIFGGDVALAAQNNVHKISSLASEEYFSNYRVVGLLAEEYNFKFYFFWQPILFVTDKPLTKEERKIYISSDPSLTKYYKATYDIVRNRATNYENLYLLDDAFDALETGIYIDWIHTVPEGNRIIANRMLNVILKAR